MSPIIGQSAPRIDALGKVTGQTIYPGDRAWDNMLHMKILFARRPHARVVSIDTSAAEAVPGVVAVFTAKDVPVNEYGLTICDQPVLCGPGSSKPGADVVRFIGDRVAVVVAETERAAEQGRDAIVVKYEDLPVVTDPIEAMAPGAPQLYPDKPNAYIHYRVRKGDVEAGFAAADVTIEGTYRTPPQEHAYLQPEAGTALIDEEGRVTVYVAGQWTHEDREQIAHALGLPEEQVRVVYDAIGGAFGGREDMSVQIVLALAVWRLHQRGINRPVKIIWSREESIIGHHKRHPLYIKARWGASREGRLVAAKVEVIGDAGAYNYTSNKVLGNATLACTGPYEIPNVAVDTYTVYTNNIPSGAFRGFGSPQGHFAAEMQMSKLAVALGMDPVELRLKNILRDDSLLSVGTPVPGGVSLVQVVEATAKAAGWTEQNGRWRRPPAPVAQAQAETKVEKDGSTRLRGLGFAACFKNVGFSFGYQENCWARVELRGGAEIEEATVYHAGADVGQGAHTVMALMAAEALGISLGKVRMVTSDTASSESSGSASASRMTFMAGNAIRGAAERALKSWQEEERPAVGEYKYLAPSTTPYDPETGYSKPNLAYGYVAEAVEVEVDAETGFVHVNRVICADDVGRAINPQQIVGQIEGAIVQAQGYALLENFQTRDGQVLTPYLSTYLIPGVLDIPDEVEAIILEHPDPNGPWGVRGMGEMPFIPLVPAIVAAVHDATGVWFDEFPLLPERVLRGLGKID
jgi:CO/xanthine dehydrogenase Mo-binding subunit